MKVPKYLKIKDSAYIGSVYIGKVIKTTALEKTSSVLLTIDFIGWGIQTSVWPPGSTDICCKCISCLGLKEATEEEYLVELVMKS